MTTPNGTPAWTRSSDHTYYGGHVSKRNYNDEPIVNPKTDVGADAIMRMAADLAAVSRMAHFAAMTIQTSTGANAPTVTACQMMTGSISSSYSGTNPPTGFPEVHGVSDGVWRVKIGGAYQDDYSVWGVFEPTFAGGSCVSSVAYLKAYVSGTAQVYFETSTSAAGETFTVWIA